jgi:hypothetical protein
MGAMKVDKNLIAFCGLYCGACSRLAGEKCHGCRENDKASWCGVRTCCLEHGFASCADCTEFPSVRNCGKFNNFIARIFGFVFRSDRAACIEAIKENGYEAFAREMTARGRRTIRPQGRCS